MSKLKEKGHVENGTHCRLKKRDTNRKWKKKNQVKTIKKKK